MIRDYTYIDLQIFRCYVVWKRVWIIAIPMLGWLAVGGAPRFLYKIALVQTLNLCLVATGVGCVYSAVHAQATSGDIFASATGSWITSFYVITLATNLMATALLAYRIWSIDRRMAHIRTRTSQLRPLLEVVVDSGLLYSITLVVALSCFVSQSTGQYFVLDMVRYTPGPSMRLTHQLI